jgi:hypothetical protein
MEPEEILARINEARIVSSFSGDTAETSDAALRDCQLLLSAMSQGVSLPDIDFEEDTGYLNLCWRFSKRSIVNVLLRGDSYVIYYCAVYGDLTMEGVSKIATAAELLSVCVKIFQEQEGVKG